MTAGTAVVRASVPAGVTRSMVSVRKGMFEVETWQKGSGTPLLVLPDLAARITWSPYLDHLANEHRVILAFPPGFRYSTGLDHLDDTVDAAIFLEDYLDALGVASA